MKKLSGKNGRCFESEEKEQPASHLQYYRPATTEENFHGIRTKSVKEKWQLRCAACKNTDT